ncbi:persephin [Choloepus didactylus]|uniref:persephin n=1 Tax=Choloepus didactylus TaxID=27675 RepID=UPI00189E4CF6|nr:persephin [Choloepus didactylus]
MTTGRALFSCLLLLSLHLGLGGCPAALGSPGVQAVEAGGPQRPQVVGEAAPEQAQLGKNPPEPPPDFPAPPTALPAASSPFSPLGARRPHARLRRALAGPCQLWSLTLPVAELGLGYASEENIIFRYCAGSCPRGARTQHSLALAQLRVQGRAHGGPCCWPTRYADVAFLDDHNRWQLLPQLSAAACGCSG